MCISYLYDTNNVFVPQINVFIGRMLYGEGDRGKWARSSRGRGCSGGRTKGRLVGRTRPRLPTKGLNTTQRWEDWRAEQHTVTERLGERWTHGGQQIYNRRGLGDDTQTRAWIWTRHMGGDTLTATRIVANKHNWAFWRQLFPATGDSIQKERKKNLPRVC